MKVVKTLILILVVIALFMQIANMNYNQNTNQNTNRKFDLFTTLNKIRKYGNNIYDYNQFFQDVQCLKWSLESVTNAMTTERGDQYTYYKFHFGPVPQGQYVAPERIVKTLYGQTYGYYRYSIKTKPDETASWWERLTYIGSTISFLFDIGISIGRLVIDTVGSLLKAVINIVILIYHLIFEI